MFYKTLFVVGAALAALVSAVPHPHHSAHVRRNALTARGNPTGSFKIYAYGDDINGLPVFYENGMAYLGAAVANMTHVSFEMNDGALAASSNQTDMGDNTKLYIIPKGDDYMSVGFTKNGSMPAGAATTTFLFYGDKLSYINSAGNYVTNFYAEPTETEDLYVLKWNNDNDANVNGTSVILEYEAPVEITERA